MSQPALTFSDDQAEAHDRISAMLRSAGIDLDDSLLTPPRDGKDSVMAVVGKAGSVFAAQSAYIVTAAGVISSKIMLEESYSGYIWAALGLFLVGLFLVQPRPSMPLAPARALNDTGH